MPLIPVSSSWIIDEDGFAYPLGGEPQHKAVYRCSGCGERGHSIRTCGDTDEQRAASRRGR